MNEKRLMCWIFVVVCLRFRGEVWAFERFWSWNRFRRVITAAERHVCMFTTQRTRLLLLHSVQRVYLPHGRTARKRRGTHDSQCVTRPVPVPAFLTSRVQMVSRPSCLPERSTCTALSRGIRDSASRHFHESLTNVAISSVSHVWRTHGISVSARCYVSLQCRCSCMKCFLK